MHVSLSLKWTAAANDNEFVFTKIHVSPRASDVRLPHLQVMYECLGVLFWHDIAPIPAD